MTSHLTIAYSSIETLALFGTFYTCLLLLFVVVVFVVSVVKRRFVFLRAFEPASR